MTSGRLWSAAAPDYRGEMAFGKYWWCVSNVDLSERPLEKEQGFCHKRETLDLNQMTAKARWAKWNCSLLMFMGLPRPSTDCGLVSGRERGFFSLEGLFISVRGFCSHSREIKQGEFPLSKIRFMVGYKYLAAIKHSPSVWPTAVLWYTRQQGNSNDSTPLVLTIILLAWPSRGLNTQCISNRKVHFHFFTVDTVTMFRAAGLVPVSTTHSHRVLLNALPVYTSSLWSTHCMLSGLVSGTCEHWIMGWFTVVLMITGL